LISARVVKVDAANDLALLKAEGRFASLPISPSRAVKLGGTVATVGFPNIGLQGFAPKFARGEIASLSGAGDDARYFQISVPVQPGSWQTVTVRAGRWWMSGATWWAWCRPN
jgi:serine protease Do